MNGDELAAVGKCGFDLDVVNHLGDAIHDLRAGEHLRPGFHQSSDAFTVPRAFQDKVGDERHCFRVVELDAAFEPAARHSRGHGDQ